MKNKPFEPYICIICKAPHRNVWNAQSCRHYVLDPETEKWVPMEPLEIQKRIEELQDVNIGTATVHKPG